MCTAKDVYDKMLDEQSRMLNFTIPSKVLYHGSDILNHKIKWPKLICLCLLNQEGGPDE